MFENVHLLHQMELILQRILKRTHIIKKKSLKKIKMIRTYQSHWKNTHIFKNVEFENLKHSKNVLKIVLKFQSLTNLLPHINGLQCTWCMKKSYSLKYNKIKEAHENFIFGDDFKLW
jgi:hypothetical protein